MPPRPQQDRHGDEGRWTSGIFALLLWQFMGSLLVECFMIYGMLVVCFMGHCRPPGPLQAEFGYWSPHSIIASVKLTEANSIFISIIILNFLMLVLIRNEMHLWAQDLLFVNRFLVSELGKMMLILPFYVYLAVDFFRVSNKWNELSWAFWLLIVIPWVWTIHGSLTSDYVQWTLFSWHSSLLLWRSINRGDVCKWATRKGDLCLRDMMDLLQQKLRHKGLPYRSLPLPLFSYRRWIEIHEKSSAISPAVGRNVSMYCWRTRSHGRG